MEKRLIAIAACYLILAAMIGTASAATMTVNSDSTWKYSVSNITGWKDLGFNDGAWIDAFQIGQESSSYWSRWGIKLPGSNAYWIWTTNWAQSGPGGDPTLYFRRQININGQPTSASMRITADDYFELYVNGAYVGSDSNWQSAHTYSLNLNEGINIIAVKAKDLYGPPKGLIADITINYVPTPPPPITPEYPTLVLSSVGVLGLLLLLRKK